MDDLEDLPSAPSSLQKKADFFYEDMPYWEEAGTGGKWMTLTRGGKDGVDEIFPGRSFGGLSIWTVGMILGFHFLFPRRDAISYVI